MTKESKHITLSQLQTRIKEGINNCIPFPIWICAEVSEIKVNYSGHCYLELVEKGGQNQVPKAKVSAVIWKNSYTAISSYFRSATGSDLIIGMQVLVKVSVSYHELYGLSLVINDIDPTYTLGDMEREKQKTIQKLKADGIYDMNHFFEIPHATQKIAVISSRNAAGYQDFMMEINSSIFKFEITLFDAFMQGNGAEESIIEALELIASSDEEFEAMIIIRGGGSQSDLACFNSYRLCSHLAQMPLPIIAGIGHDKDQSVADLVAALSLKTPTAVATYLVESVSNVYDTIVDRDRLIREKAKYIIDSNKQQLTNNAHLIQSTYSNLTRSVEVTLASLMGDIKRMSETLVMTRLNRLDFISETLSHRSKLILNRERNRVLNCANLIDSRRPESILALGFAIVSQNGKAVKDSQGIQLNSEINITLSKGSVGAKIIKINN